MKVKRSFFRSIKLPRFSSRFFDSISAKLKGKRKAVLISSGSFLAVAILVIGTFLPAILARAEQTLTWTSNADFAYNKISGDCSPITLEGLEVEGAAYTDEDCSEAEADASLKLASSDSDMRGIQKISHGPTHSLALKSDGTVWAWGTNTYGELGDGSNTSTILPVKVKSVDGNSELTGVTDISAGVNSSCAVSSGAAYCWGRSNYGQLGNGNTNSYNTPVAVSTSIMSGAVTKISIGLDSACAIASGQAYCWGRNNSNQLGVFGSDRSSPIALPTSTMTGTVTDISVGSRFACAVADSKAYCWGAGTNGQIGSGGTTSSYTIQAVTTTLMSGNVTAISAGSYHACAISSGQAYCWGNGSSGKLGNGVGSNSSVPVAVSTSIMSGVVSDISAGSRQSVSSTHTCAIADGTAYCWGENGNGQLGDGSTTSANTPVAVSTVEMDGEISDISAGDISTCAVEDGYLNCWGSNATGQTGIQNYGRSAVSSPYKISESADIDFMQSADSFSGGTNHTCAVIDGDAYCWGRNNYGQLGNGSNDDSNYPVAVDKSLMSGPVTSISVGYYHTCALSSGSVYCWGIGDFSSLGNGSTTSSNVPVAVETSLMSGTVSAIASGYYHTCAISSGQVFCWGQGGDGRLGNGATTTSSTPVAVNNGLLSSNVTSITAGNAHTCAIASGAAYCWGDGANGKLGNAESVDKTSPVAVIPAGMTGTVTAISASDAHTCAIASGSAYCWGNGGNGRLGNSSTSTYNVPAAVTTNLMSGTVTSISTGYAHSCAVASNLAYCWGNGSYGQIGNGATSSTNSSPVAVSTTTMSGSVTKLNLGAYYSCATTSDKTYCWGAGYYGVLGSYGLNTGTSVATGSSLPIPVTFVEFVNGYSPSGTMNGAVVDVGQGKKTKWYSIGWETEALPENTSISFSARTSDDNSTWSAWTPNFTQDADGSTSGFGDLDSLTMSRYIEIRAEFTSDSSSSTPTLNDFTLSFLEDEQPPEQNASNLTMQRQKDDSAVSPGGWTNLQSPYFAWDAAKDNVNGSGIQGYCLYIGKDETADPIQTKGLLGDSPVDTGGACPYSVSEANIDLGVVDALASGLETSSDPYVLLVSAIDFSGNVYAGDPASFSFRYDDEPPRNPSFISAPSQFVSTKEVTLTWPTGGAESAQDSDSGVAGLQYRIGSGGVWYGDSHTGEQNAQDLLENDGTYVTDETYDYPDLQEGNNIIYFRTYDQAGNVSESHITTVVKINTSSPTSPQNLTATPTTNTSNSFAFNWLAPASFVGQPSGIVYCYTVNVLPNSGNCNYTNPGQRSLPADAFATQPGVNTFYVVARDEANNINYDTYASVTFTANTPAPGIVRDFEIADVSTKASSLWKLAISWSEPENTGAGVSKYVIERSTNGTDFAQVANTSGLSHVDSGLSQQQYFYKVRACDSANNCGAFSEATSMTPTGRFTTPPELVGNVTSQVGTRTASFAWATDRNSDSRIQYGTTSGVYLPSEVTVSDQTQAHELELFNLEAGTTYYYKVKWTDEDGNTGVSSELSFTTLPAPSIKDVEVVKKNLTSAIVQFTSTEATKVELLYGKSDSFGGVKTINTSRSESTYLVELTGLDDGSNYSFRLNTFDSEGNKYDSNRTDSFETPPRPRISNLRFQPVAGQPTSTQEITWSTNVPADSTITYGKIGTNGTDVYSSQKTSDHKIIIKGLEDDSNYFLLAQSRDADGNLAISDRQVFRTALDTRAPSISDIKVTTAIKGSGGDARGQIVVYWKTDEPSTSQVAYGLGASGTDFPNRTAQDSQLTTDHVVIISDLPVANVYYLQPVSSDRSNNTTSGDSRSAVIGRPTDSILTIIINSIQSILGI